MTPFRVDAQLQSGSATEGDDCAFQCARGAVRALTDGATVPTVKEMRTLVGVPSGGIAMPTVRDIINHYVPGSARFSTVLDDLWPVLAAPGYLAIAAINYRTLNATWPELSGDRGFNGTADKPALHAVGFDGLERVLDKGTRGPWWSQYLDPLHDGRVKNAKRLPKQIVMIRRAQIETLTGAVPSGVQLVLCKPV